MKTILSLIAFSLAAQTAFAAIKTETVEYKEGDTTLEGVLIYDDSIVNKRPGILIAHQWKGLTDYEKKRGEMLAKLGYVAFAADIYGKGVRPKDTQEAGQFAGKYKGERDLLRRRVQAGFEQLKKSRFVDAEKTAAIGYCFGGTTVLELARAGADVDGVVSFHGGLGTPTPDDAKKIKGKVLALHGADDPFVPPAEEQAFEEEMRKAKVDWQLVAYGNSVHSFTDWNAGNDNSKGAAYNEKADKRSWEDMRDFFNELFGSSLSNR
ncbi:MAG TPA: dienelactone hydrolase family protein [Verrucomicrobiae bacterium]